MASAAPSSRMERLYARHRAALRRIDDLESRLASRVSAHRRRATNLVDEVPTSRRTHARIFVSHRVEGGDDDDDEEEEDKEEASAPAAAPAPAAAAARPGGKDFSALLHSSAHQPVEQAAKKPTRGQPNAKGVRKWTLVVEGGLLVKHLDHESAKAVDARLDAGLPILGHEGLDEEERGAHKADVPLRDQWRGGAAEREGEKDVEPLIFTHLFDRMDVELKVIKRKSDKEQLETSAVTRNGLGAVPPPPEPEAVAEVKTFTWERARSNTPDSNAFFVAHNEASDFESLGGKVFKSVFNVDHVKARVKLYRRQGEEGNYVPSRAMCEVFFPTFIGKRAAAELKTKDKSGKSKKRKKSGGGGEAMARSDSSSNLQNDASNSSIPPGKEAAFASRQSSALSSGDATPAPEPEVEVTDFHVPHTVTVDEALQAIFFYIRTRNLQDATDLSIVNNDEKLSNLFGCSRMLFSAVRGLLLERQLLVKVQPGTHPIVFNYDMTLDGAEPLTKKRKAKPAEPQGDTPEKDKSKRRSAKADPDDETDEPAEGVPHQTMLSCDVDVEVPNLFHVRTRDVLRRIKCREFEYTSGRVKALRSLLSAGVNEETAKNVLNDAVAGKGYAPHHKQVWMALAKGSHDGGEAQRAAYIDLRTTSLMEKLEERCSVAQGYWDVAKACQDLCKDKEEK